MISKLLKITLVFGLLFSSQSCSKDFNPWFFIDTFAEVSIPAGLGQIERHYFVLENVPTFFDSYSSAVNADTSQISQIIGRQAILRPRQSNINLDFINNASIYIINPFDITDDREIFFLDFIDFGEKDEIRLFNSIVNIKDLISNDQMLLELRLDLRQPSLQTFDLLLDLSFSAFEIEE